MSLEKLRILGEKNNFEVPDKIQDIAGLQSSQDEELFIPKYFDISIAYGDDFSEILLNLAIETKKNVEDKFVALRITNMGGIVKNFPSEIEKLKNLRALDISWWGGKIPSIPKEIFSLTNLELLTMTHNKFNDLPGEIDQLKNLKELNIKNNEIKSIPKEIGKLKNLETLNLKKNKLETVPDELLKLEKLERLWLNGNNISKEEENKIKQDVSNNVNVTFFP